MSACAPHPACPSRILAAGLAVSLAWHALISVAFAFWAGGVGRPAGLSAPRPAPAALHEPADERRVFLGIEHSAAEHGAWLGFDTATDHQAERGITEQSALVLEPPGDGERQAPSGEAAVLSNPASSARPEPRPAAIDVAEVRARVGDFQERIAGLIGELAAARAPAEPPVTPDSPPSPAERAGSGGGEAGPSGIVSDKESTPSALEEAHTVIPGRVLAARGLEIMTRRPQWATTTLVTRTPRNPVVRIVFGRDGRVKTAYFVPDGPRTLSTGYPDVDEPLLSAVYTWRAKGTPLARLPRNDADAGIALTLRIILVPE